jgi:hypothetical protein
LVACPTCRIFVVITSGACGMNDEDPVDAHKRDDKANKRRKEKELHGSLAAALTRLLFFKSFSWSQGLGSRSERQTERERERLRDADPQKNIFFLPDSADFRSV